MLTTHCARRAGLAFFALVALHSSEIVGDDGPFPSRHVLRSSNVVLHTDVPADEARKRLAGMEATLTSARRYWRQGHHGKLECYLIADLQNWPDSALPHPLARIWVGGIGGATIGESFGGHRRVRGQATVYSAARAAVIEHEVIHAYCVQAFNEMGPDWYKEGMAEVISLHVAQRDGVACTAERIQLLRDVAPRTVGQIVAMGPFTEAISSSLRAMLQNRQDMRRHVPLDDWTLRDADQLKIAMESYAWSWALCHLLFHSPNYSERFRALGISYLSKRDDSFSAAFSSVGDELEFELAFFARRIGVGYRVDLCSWDWDKQFLTLDDRPVVQTRVLAARGFQPSGLTVSRGKSYRFVSTGTWLTCQGGKATDADGASAGDGQLVGVILSEMQLGGTLPLGTDGTFVAPATGQLYLRCQEPWNQIADNTGEIQVRFAAH